MFKTLVLSIVLIFTFSLISIAQETSQEEKPKAAQEKKQVAKQEKKQEVASVITVDEMAICTSVEEREPVGTDTAFVKTVGQLYCFVKLSGGSDDTSIFHNWFYKNKEMAKVELSVRGKTWRTWSSKRIVEDWVGNWKVEVTSATGDVLKTVEFVVK